MDGKLFGVLEEETTTLKVSLPKSLISQLEVVKDEVVEYEGLTFSQLVKEILLLGLDSLEDEDPRDWGQ